MRMDPRCFQCLLSRVRFECDLVIHDDGRVDAIVEQCRQRLEELRSLPITAPRIATEIHQTACHLAGVPDPYRELKQRNNLAAAEVCRSVRPSLRTFRDRVLASIIGNTMDYAVENHDVAEDFLPFFIGEFERGLAVDDTDAILELTDRVVYLTDNCGEIVFDRLLIEDLVHRGSHVTLAVKGSPILNDATLSDARDIGLEDLVDTLTTTGSGDVGIALEKVPSDLARALEKATLVISKGMANYEALNEEKGLPPVAYLLAAKCDPIARSLNVARGSYVALLLMD
ncbi:MAG: ARMT1-like domain-containing protein [Methanomicrobiales archaeon]|nr:ARMT1-like domain-containing protein [Methanomicrobiales archaeon]